MPQKRNISDIYFIINPISGCGKGKDIPELLEKYLDHSKFGYQYVFTSYKGVGTRLCKAAIDRGVKAVIAVGGDGTVHEVGKALIGTNVSLGIIPIGSGNGLALHCKIPMDPKTAIERINKMDVTAIDTIQIDKDHYLNVAGIGFDAHVAWKFANLGKRGLYSYMKIAIRDFFNYCCKEYELDLDGMIIKRNAFLISFANSSQYGNNFLISPNGNISDAVFEVIIVRPFSLISVPGMLYNLMRSKLNKSKYIEVHTAKEVILHGGRIRAHLDGEPVILSENARFKILPKSLNLIT